MSTIAPTHHNAAAHFRPEYWYPGAHYNAAARAQRQVNLMANSTSQVCPRETRLDDLCRRPRSFGEQLRDSQVSSLQRSLMAFMECTNFNARAKAYRPEPCG